MIKIIKVKDDPRYLRKLSVRKENGEVIVSTGVTEQDIKDELLRTKKAVERS
jgi:hypothetical protein